MADLVKDRFSFGRLATVVAIPIHVIAMDIRILFLRWAYQVPLKEGKFTTSVETAVGFKRHNNMNNCLLGTDTSHGISKNVHQLSLQHIVQELQGMIRV